MMINRIIFNDVNYSLYLALKNMGSYYILNSDYTQENKVTLFERVSLLCENKMIYSLRSEVLYERLSFSWSLFRVFTKNVLTSQVTEEKIIT